MAKKKTKAAQTGPKKKRGTRAAKPDPVTFAAWIQSLPEPCIPLAWIAPYCGISRTAASNAVRDGAFDIHRFTDSDGRAWDVATVATAEAHRERVKYAARRWDYGKGGYCQPGLVEGTASEHDRQRRMF